MSISPDRILYSDDHLLVVSKRAGELSVKAPGEGGTLPLYDFLHKDYPGLRVVHRLDFDTSGVLLFAKTKAAADAILASGFSGWKKTYRAIVAGHLPLQRGVIRAELPARSGKTRNPKPFLAGRQAETRNTIPAVTHYHVLQSFFSSTYAECTIETGRHHQIRRHFAKIGHPLVLDAIYGDEKFNRSFGRATGYRKFFLHAFSLDLPHPISGEQLHIEAELPRPFQEVLKKLEARS